MDRRESLKALTIGSLSVGAILTGCDDKKPALKEKDKTGKLSGYGRTAPEEARDQVLMAETFFTATEMKTITVLVDIIIPADEHSGSASELKVPAFIEFMAKDQPQFKLPLRGGLRWLDVHCMKHYNNAFTDCTPQQQIELIDQIAYPEEAKPEMSQGVAFFSLMRDLTANGFFTTQAGIKDLGYKGNVPNEWDGVPADVLKQYDLAYDEKLLPLYVKMEDRGKIMTWD
ncbi:gluconate 2-dehydrogenase subunit 3 family protein [Chitinophaga rhizophila]|uniref:Gluconate 2-dehydrogenase subunit 3 family protein n=1 Tax=Chitinophaga rhizophila TaxID=2866212 RepID=A0ABS7GI78_9BACT|nr:gluconate 2-dehydrogenase subunit 3 family protein [Chitinophaga rhizophila]MBW8686173.1 gluconate 2-dehydrogenase subunit 3 family protein [Chitinophaga rhizophila]